MEKTTTFSERLKELMEETNSTQDKISKIAGCGRGSISTWLSGQYYPTIKNLLRLSEYFSCSIEFILGRTDNPDINDYAIYTNFSQRLTILAQSIKKNLNIIAKELNIDSTILYRWSKEVYQPTAIGLEMLADYFGCSVDYLIGRKQ